MFNQGLLISKRRFQDWAVLEETAVFRAHAQQILKAHHFSTKHQTLHCKQDECTSSLFSTV